MDAADLLGHFSNMAQPIRPIPAYGLYGETGAFPDIMHCERVPDRAALHGWRIAPHRHGALHQFFLIGAGARASLDGRTLTMEGPTLLSAPRWTVHGFRFEPGQEGYVLSVAPDAMPELFGVEADCAGELDVWRAAPAPPELEAHFATILEELRETRPLRNARMRANVVEIAVALLRGSAREEAGRADTPQRRHMRAFEALLRTRLQERWTVAQYAQALGLSPTHLGRVTRALTGLSAARFIEARLFQEARRQLAYTREPVAEIAYRLGFDDPAYFSRAFRRVEGRSPTEYRAALEAERPAKARTGCQAERVGARRGPSRVRAAS
ncbi:MAG: helix-turn-helix domain-containing protein [Pseudomonadota bacterium]